MTDDSKYAIIRSGGKQYRVMVGHVVSLEKLVAEVGETVKVTDVLAVHNGKKLEVGAPLVKGAVVDLEIVDQYRGKKIHVFKKKRRQNYRRFNTHRQDLTRVRVSAIHAA